MRIKKIAFIFSILEKDRTRLLHMMAHFAKLNEVEHLKGVRWKVNIAKINHSKIYSASRPLLHLQYYPSRRYPSRFSQYHVFAMCSVM